jgi:hypothetical protein
MKAIYSEVPYVSGTLNGSSGATGGGETVVVQEQQQTVTGTGYDTNGQFVFEVYNNSAYDIYALYIGVINASSDHDIDVLPQILPTAAPLLWARLQWETGRRQSGRCMLRM